MKNNLNMLEEFDIIGKFQYPHMLFFPITPVSKKQTAYLMMSKREDEILLISSPGFGNASVVAGLTEKNIEYLAKKGPRDFKEAILKILQDQIALKEILEIAKSMDDDVSGNATQNQSRIKNVIQYIKDNRVVFEV
ncbi:MAG: hypothetical protein A2Z52_01130 [Candidatus Moranbacteria bacterium RBG_19FT_COMBO_42_6]|nr:MAG: hypothetical protein A2Z52_01130 [Candidatus Moranbacteria bacterium RBG_19FT_COMBO_42_6]